MEERLYGFSRGETVMSEANRSLKKFNFKFEAPIVLFKTMAGSNFKSNKFTPKMSLANIQILLNAVVIVLQTSQYILVNEVEADVFKVKIR
jgi:hypothetical protein